MPHIHEKIDFTATVLVVYNDRVLLRLHDKYHIWVGVGGHIELDEDANTAALREVKEEVGLDVTLVPPPHWQMTVPDSGTYRELIPPMFMNIHQINPLHQHHDLIFIARSTNDAVIPENPTDTWQWCNKEEIESHADLDPRVREYALYALAVTKA